MTTSAYEAVPAVARDDATPRGDTVVMKFGGTSVADAEKLKHVARRLVCARERGARVVGVLSAMGSTTDELLDRAWSDAPSALRDAATVTLAAHLDKLAEEGRLPDGVERPQLSGYGQV